MADEIQLSYVAPGLPVPLMQAWRDSPPEPLRDGKFHIVDEAYDTLIFEARYMDWPQKITMVASLGLALLWKGFMESQFKLVVRFDDAGDGEHTKIGITGQAHPRTRAALAQMAAQYGGPVGLAVGVS
jgi:hypothetical protein